MLLLVWLLCGTILIVALHKRLWIFAGLIVTVRLFVPQVAGSVLVGSSDNLHPATWWTFLAFGLVLLLRGPLLLEELRGSRGVYVAATVLAAATLILTVWQRAPVNLWGLLNTLIAALLLFALVRCSIRQHHDSRGRLARWFVMIAVIQSVIGGLQVALNDALFYVSYRTKAFWFDANSIDRALGTADSPLDLTLLLLTALPLTLFIRRVLLKLVAIGILGAGILLTQSRVGLLMFAFVLLIILLRARVPAYAKIFGLLALPGVALFTLRSEIAEGTLGRFVDDSGSAVARQRALDYFLSNAERSAFLGQGFGSSFDARTIGAINTSLESSFLMFFIDFGGVITALLGILLIVLLLQARKTDSGPGLLLAAIAAIAITASYSGFMTQGAASMILWFVLALASAPRCLGNLSAGELPEAAQHPTSSSAAAYPRSRPATLRHF